MNKKISKRVISIALLLVMFFAFAPIAARAETLDSLNGATLYEGTPPASSFLREIDAGAITKKTGQTGFYQRLPRLTHVCQTDKSILSEYIPDYYSVASSGGYTVSDPSVIGDCGFALANWAGGEGYNGYPCLQFTYTAKSAGRTTVTLTVFYNYNFDGESGYCPVCREPQRIPADKNWYQEIITFTVTVIDETKYAVTYTDGVENEEVFPDQIYRGLLSGAATPRFDGTPARRNYLFAGWDPAVAENVVGDAVYTAVWKEDRNNNGEADEDETKYAVTYTDGVENEEVFPDQIYRGLLSGTATPRFDGTPARSGYVFSGWNPQVAAEVSGNATYTATWTKIPEEPRYHVTYTDGVKDEIVFADQRTTGLRAGEATPAFQGTPTRPGYEFAGWSPSVVKAVIGDAVYTATWRKIAEPSEYYSVRYTDGVDGEEVFADQVYSGLPAGTAIPAFRGTPAREGYTFAGWKDSAGNLPAVAVTTDIVYYAQWEKKPPVITEETGAVSDTGETTDPSAGTTEIPGAVTDTTGGAGEEPVTGESGTTEKSGEDAPYTGDRKVLPLILLAASCAGAFGIAVCFQRKKETK
ncbi:MAG: InlB B-repeat-containing protein [Eubacteriales bacterium]